MTDEQITEIFNRTKPFTYKAFARALLSASKPAATEGWKLVPIELTECMRDEADFAMQQHVGDDYTEWDDFDGWYQPIWSAMLAAAPAAPSADMQDERGALTDADLLMMWAKADYMLQDEWLKQMRAFLAASTSANVAPAATVQAGEAVALGWPWLAELHADAAYLFHRVQQGTLSPDDAAKSVRKKIDAAQAAFAAPQPSQPVEAGETYVRLFRASTGDVFKALRTDSVGIAELLHEGWEIAPSAVVLDDERIEQRADEASSANGYGVEDGTGIAHSHWWTFDRDGLHKFARAASPQATATQPAQTDDPIALLIEKHAEQLEDNEYAYFELAYTRRTEWMAWICSNHRDDDSNRKVIARGQGSTPQSACEAALSSAAAQPASGDDTK